MMQRLACLFWFFGFSFFPANTYAYIDPGSGSFVLQMLFASLLGGLFTLKMYFQKIKQFFKGKKLEPLQQNNDVKTFLNTEREKS